jgi:hypothetical protein
VEKSTGQINITNHGSVEKIRASSPGMAVKEQLHLSVNERERERIKK